MAEAENQGCQVYVAKSAKNIWKTAQNPQTYGVAGISNIFYEFQSLLWGILILIRIKL